MTSQTEARVEALIAAAHNRCWMAADAASLLRDQGTADDLYQIADELRRVLEARLRNARVKRKPPQLVLHPPSD